MWSADFCFCLFHSFKDHLFISTSASGATSHASPFSSRDVFRKHCRDYECNISSPAVWTSPERVASLWKKNPLNSRDLSRHHSSWTEDIYSSLKIRYLREVAPTSSPNWKSYDVCVFLSDRPLEQYHSSIYSSSGASAFVSCTFVFHLRVTSGNGPPVSIVI